jgi:hypothetical protein
MLSELAATLLDQWFDLARPALAAWPVGRAVVTDVPGLVFAVNPPARPGSSWLLVVRLRVPRRSVPMSGPGIIPPASSPLPALVEDRAEESFPDRGRWRQGPAALPDSWSRTSGTPRASGDPAPRCRG